MNKKVKLFFGEVLNVDYFNYAYKATFAMVRILYSSRKFANSQLAIAKCLDLDNNSISKLKTGIACTFGFSLDDMTLIMMDDELYHLEEVKNVDYHATTSTYIDYSGFIRPIAADRKLRKYHRKFIGLSVFNDLNPYVHEFHKMISDIGDKL